MPSRRQPVASLPLDSGTGGASFVTDITSQGIAALSGGFPEMSWMLTGAMEGEAVSPAPANVDCRPSMTSISD